MRKKLTAEEIITQCLSPEFSKRFWEKVKKTDDCWVWIGGSAGNGYGGIGIGSHNMISAHRASWIIHNGPIPQGLCVLHHCDNHPCVRPDHLWVGTNLQNTHDMIAKGRDRCPPFPLFLGEQCSSSKLTECDVRMIRQILSECSMSQRKLAAKFGVHLATIKSIRSGRTWKHVPDAPPKPPVLTQPELL